MRFKLLLFTLLCSLAAILPGRAQESAQNDKADLIKTFRTATRETSISAKPFKAIKTTALKSVPEGYAQVTLNAGDMWGDGSGYQMLLDADATAYGTIFTATSSFTTSGDASASTYAEFEYKIPENADGACSTSNIVINNSISILIPAGTYDWCITNPTPGDKIYIASNNGSIPGRYDNYVFESGCSYFFELTRIGTGDGVNLDVINPNLPAVPADLSVVPGLTTGEVSWVERNEATEWNIRYRPYVFPSKTWDFNTEDQFNEWTIIDNDGDGNNWHYSSSGGHSGGCAESNSYGPGVLTPDNFLISPKVPLKGTLTLWAGQYSSSYPDNFAVYIIDSEDNLVKIGGDYAPTSWTQYSFDLSQYNGQIGYIVIRHYNCTNQYRLRIDDITLNTGDVAPEWIEVDGLNSIPYTIEGLNPDTEYEVQVQSVKNNIVSDWTSSNIFRTLAADAMPFNLEVTDITDRTATANWNGAQDNYNLRYRTPFKKGGFFEDFENGIPNDWTNIDADGDGYKWNTFTTTSLDSQGNPTVFDTSCATSASYDGTVLHPDNWLITPQVELKGNLSVWLRGQDPSWAGEHFAIYLSTSGNTVTDFTNGTVLIPETTAQDVYTEYTADLSAYNGQMGYIAIRHFNCSDMFRLNVDNFYIKYGEDIPAGEWVTIPNVTSPYTIEGLDPETEYEVQVQGILDNGTTNWTNSTYFTTLELQAIEATLAYIETFGQGICGDMYTITDQLIAIDYNDGYNNDVYLWCKDQGNASVHATQPKDGQVDFMIQQGAQSGNWDQSNWVVLMISGENAHSIAASAKGHYLTGVTGIYVDDNNYMIEVIDNNFTISEETATYTPNVYCTANFINSNLTFDEESEGAFNGDNDDTSYFFMNPKIQEYCNITWAQWDADKGYFIAPDNTGFDGAFFVDWFFNKFGSNVTLVDGEQYEFNAIVQLAPIKNSTDPDETYIVYPMDLSSDSLIPTAINTISANGEVVGVEYVNSLGMTSDKPFQGVNIVVTRYSNGATTTVKKVFK